jgi:hypothetical protein
VDRLRQSRDAATDEPWLVLSAADPLNLFGIVTSDPRIAATHRNAVIVQSGRLIASRQAGAVEFNEPQDEATEWTMRRALTLGRRPDATPAEPAELRRSRL